MKDIEEKIEIKGAKSHNLKDIDVQFQEINLL